MISPDTGVGDEERDGVETGGAACVVWASWEVRCASCPDALETVKAVASMPTYMYLGFGVRGDDYWRRVLVN
jgi:hypothetical protein